MDEHLRFCKRTYKNDEPINEYVGSAFFEYLHEGFMIVEGRLPDDEAADGMMYYDHDENATYVFNGEQWLQMTGPGPAGGI